MGFERPVCERSVFERFVDDAVLVSSGIPVDEALRAYRMLSRDPLAGPLRCPAARFDELREHLIPEDLLDLAVVAGAGADGLPGVLDGFRREPRVRPVSLHVVLPRAADQARATAVTIARLPADTPAYIGVRHRSGRRVALDRIAAARARGVPLGVEFRAEDAAEFVPACRDRGVPFTCTASHPSASLLLGVLLLAAGVPAERATAGAARRAAADGGRTADSEQLPVGGRHADAGSGPPADPDPARHAAPDPARHAAPDPARIADAVRRLDGGAVREARRLFRGFAVPDVAALRRDLDDLGPVRTRDNGEDLSP